MILQRIFYTLIILVSAFLAGVHLWRNQLAEAIICFCLVVAWVTIWRLDHENHELRRRKGGNVL